jgi:hypothetical protein
MHAYSVFVTKYRRVVFTTAILEELRGILFPQRLGADPSASLVCGLHLKFTPSSNPTILRALRTQNS